ncbi:aconitate hydratase AcnA [Falsiroseomonas ponticola]|uniref:aconitate hydratase AcnA n=1 Tax=Falsiroseomonas ponticola TaxID=2786951 RepID=UPI001932347C|nr:aconitate hydratase AcnA [Roseomonas ponticola]
MARDSFGAWRTLTVGGEGFDYASLPALGEALGVDLSRHPFALRVLLENILRNEDGLVIPPAQVEALARWPAPNPALEEVAFHPARVLMPDSSGVPLLIDLAMLRDALAARGLDPRLANPGIPVELVLDHSVTAEFTGSADAFAANLRQEMARNRERYAVVRWAMAQVANLRVVPPGNGIVHHVNLEHLATGVVTGMRDGRRILFPDSLVGTDSHTPMINALGIFGWGVGGIEAMTALLGQPVSLPVPAVVGCRLLGRPGPGVLVTDVVLTLTQALRRAGVVGAVVEFHGPGIDALTLPDRATLANMAAEYGATMGFFPLEAEAIRYLAGTGRAPAQVARVEAYARAQGLWREPGAAAPHYARSVDFDLGAVEPSLAGPSRPEDRVPLSAVPASFHRAFAGTAAVAPPPGRGDRALRHGDIAIAAIASCTNTANPHQVIAAGLLARNAAARGLAARPWVKASMSPGSRVVTAMLEKAGLLAPLAATGFHVIGYGCMTCGSGAGPLLPETSAAIARDGLVALGVISTNRNFEGRLNAQVGGTYLASPPLVVAYAIAGTVLHDLAREPLGLDEQGRPVMLAELWPGDAEIHATMARNLDEGLFHAVYGGMADGGPEWAALPVAEGARLDWRADSLSILPPPFLEPGLGTPAGAIRGARPLLILGDAVTTDHISPGGTIPAGTPAGEYLAARGLSPRDFGTYIDRRANHEVMIRGTFANTRLRNAMAPGREGGFTRHMPGGEVTTVFEAAERYRAEGVPLVVVAGTAYGNGSSRDWAAKGTRLLGVRAVIAEDFERIHRSNLVGMGVVPLQFPPGVTRLTLALDGSETFDIDDPLEGFAPGRRIGARIHRGDGRVEAVSLVCRADTQQEALWLRAGGILPYALRRLVEQPAPVA